MLYKNVHWQFSISNPVIVSDYKLVSAIQSVRTAILMQAAWIYLQLLESSFWWVSAKSVPCLGAGLQGAVSIRKTVLPGMAIPMLKIRRPNGRLIFNMEIAIRR